MGLVMDASPKSQEPAKPITPKALRGKSTRRDVLKIWTIASVGLPLVVTLAPTEAKAQDSETS